MESAVQSGRRDERVPLDALIELCAEDGDEVLEADGLDLSPGGLAVRAAFVPPIGARLKCQFRCSPDGERVRAEGEVVWAEWETAHDGAFGVRFLELDTKSATAIRRYMEPENDVHAPVPEVAQTTAQLCIDGVGAPVDTDVLYTDPGSIVLEQELNFLRLGRGVSVEVSGRARRGRIGSVELRHGPLDVPTLVFGILLDAEIESAEPEHYESVVSLRARGDQVACPLEAPTDFEDGLKIAASSAATAQASTTASFDEMSRFAQHESEAPEARDAGIAFDRAIKRAARASEAEVPAAASSEFEEAELKRVPPLQAALGMVLLLWARLQRVFARLRGPALDATVGRASKVTQAFSIYSARVRLFVGTQTSRWAKVRKEKQDARRRTTAPAPRVQRSAVGAGRAEAQRPVKANARGSRLFAVALAVVGVALGVYTLAPRSGADRIRVQRGVAPQVSDSVLPAADALAEPSDAVQGEPSAPSASGAAVAAMATATTEAAQVPAAAQSPAVQAQAPVEQALAQLFGEENVPHGRTFTLRMSGPVEGLEGERRDDGFTVRVPGRLALDRASPIATSHRAVARAMILNRGDYAELTVDFLPGLRPKYQVVGKDASIEVTLERL